MVSSQRHSKAVLVFVGASLLLCFHCMSSFGELPSGERLTKIESSPEYFDGEFKNNPEVANVKEGAFWAMIRRQLFGDEERVPPYELLVIHPDLKEFPQKANAGLRAVWFGHSSLLLEIDGLRVFVDPVLSKRASPFTSVGPERFFPPPIELENLPHIDAVVISHDHYDHLSMETSAYLARKGTRFYVPLGVGAHLEAWGVPLEQIFEMDWWDTQKLEGIEIVCTPAVHYSGRGLLNRNQTLWSSWTLIGPKHRFFYSGDTGYSKHFSEIGDRFGPFDLTAIKIGAYDWTWDGIHMDAEHAVAAHVDVRGKRMFPVHWGTFNLAIHRWDEPIDRAIEASKNLNVKLVTPAPGEIFDADLEYQSKAWWLKEP